MEPLTLAEIMQAANRYAQHGITGGIDAKVTTCYVLPDDVLRAIIAEAWKAGATYREIELREEEYGY